MDLQKAILSQFMNVYTANNGVRPTLKNISEQTGIQTTRVFRIFNGSEMKLKEYESFKKAISSHDENKSNLISLAEQSLLTLGTKGLQDIAKMMMRKIELFNLGLDFDYSTQTEIVA